ncbi:hypothetical protein PLESTB_000839400 [Pleodorina starrii]|uniref:Seipin n=1 Tax=Pleodorina starrii TaxID=330485 RepID=A0A9W6BMF9_9CHLO|nr:hypothetical protein PLESTB_000839400 [Pleodorina starrii]GLC64451.1 hypothetical protein PLESTF_000167400 [Pleodorina starrii]
MLRRFSSLAPVAVTCGAALSFSFALLGYTLLGFLFLTRYYAPASHHYVRPLHFDYTGYVAVATAPLSPNLREQAVLNNNPALPGAAAALLPKSRFLPCCTQVAIHVVLTIPADHTDLFQVTGEMLANTTHIAARSTRTYINTRQPYAYRLAKEIILLPLHVLGFGHGDWVRVDLPLFNAYEDREDSPVALFRARLASRNASRGGLPPPPVHHAELHVRLRMGLFQTVLFWLRPGLVLSVFLLLVGLMASIVGTTGTAALLLLAFFLRRWIAKMAAADSKDKAHRGALPLAAARRKVAPYGSFDDALSYSLAHAEYYRDEELRSPGEDDVDGGPPTEPRSRGRPSRQGSLYSEAPKMYEDDTASRGNGGVHVQLDHVDSPAWSGSSGDAMYTPAGGSAAAAAGARPPSRQGSGAPSATSKLATAAGVMRPSPSSSPQPPADAEEDEEKVEHYAGGDGVDGAAEAPEAAGGETEEEDQEFTGNGDELPDDGKRPECTSGMYEEGSDGEGSELAADDGRRDGGEEQSGAAGLKDTEEGPAEAMYSDLDPQADNEAAGAALRRRAVYAWKA